MPTNMGSRRSSHAIKQLSVTKDDSFEEEEESEEEEVQNILIPILWSSHSIVNSQFIQYNAGKRFKRPISYLKFGILTILTFSYRA